MKSNISFLLRKILSDNKLSDMFHKQVNNEENNDYGDKYLEDILKKVQSGQLDIKSAINKIKKNIISSYSIVRWFDNENEDVVCLNAKIAKKYVENYNKLAGEKCCYVDEEVWLPLE